MIGLFGWRWSPTGPLHHPPDRPGRGRLVGSVADSYDNAMAESLNATFKTELIHRRTWRSRDQIEYDIVECVGRYDRRRRHTAIGDVPPIEYETPPSCPMAPG